MMRGLVNRWVEVAFPTAIFLAVGGWKFLWGIRITNATRRLAVWVAFLLACVFWFR